jgi:hypothetical protein
MSLPLLLACLAAALLVPVAAAAGTPGPAAQGTPPASLLDAVRADAARRTGVQAGSIQVVRTEAREWPDGSLGCPQPGQSYIQVITPGFLLVLRAGGRQLEYHTDATARLTFCRDTAATPGLPGTGSLGAGPAGTTTLLVAGLAAGALVGLLGAAAFRARPARRR